MKAKIENYILLEKNADAGTQVKTFSKEAEIAFNV
jgi:hypothetical protein